MYACTTWWRIRHKGFERYPQSEWFESTIIIWKMLCDYLTNHISAKLLFLSMSIIKSCIGFRLAYLHLTLSHSKGQDQGYAHVYDEYLGYGDRYGKIIIIIKQQVSIGILTFGLGTFWRSRTRSCIFHQWISWIWWLMGKTLLFQSGRKSCIGFRLSYLHWTLIHSKGQSPGHAYSKCI